MPVGLRLPMNICGFSTVTSELEPSNTTATPTDAVAARTVWRTPLGHLRLPTNSYIPRGPLPQRPRGAEVWTPVVPCSRASWRREPQLGLGGSKKSDNTSLGFRSSPHRGYLRVRVRAPIDETFRKRYRPTLVLSLVFEAYRTTAALARAACFHACTKRAWRVCRRTCRPRPVGIPCRRIYPSSPCCFSRTNCFAVPRR